MKIPILPLTLLFTTSLWSEIEPAFSSFDVLETTNPPQSQERVQLQEGSRLDEFLGYKNVTILKVEPDGIRIRHEGGVQSVPIERLSEENRKKFSLRAEGVEDYRRWKAENRIREERLRFLTEKIQKQALTIEGEIFQVVGGSRILLNHAIAKNARLVEKKVPYTAYYRAPALDKNQSRRSETRYRTIRKYENDYIAEYVSIECDTVNHFDGDIFSQKCYPIGSFSYTTLAGGNKTVRNYTNNFDSAMIYLKETRPDLFKDMGNLEDNSLEDLIIQFEEAKRDLFQPAPEAPAKNNLPFEFENTTWAFLRHDKAQLGTIKFLPDGSIESRRYSAAGWRKSGDNAIIFKYDAKNSDEVGMLFQFTDETLNEMMGAWETGTRRFMRRLSE